MMCAFFREVLALYVEGDLSDHSAAEVDSHLARCPQCETFCEQLQKSQAVLKSLRSSIATPAALSEVRQEVMSRIDGAQQTLGFALRLERFMLLGFRKWRYAAACVAVLATLAVLSAKVDGHRQTLQRVDGTLFDGKNTLVRPDGYREWVSVGSAGSEKSVYINPAAYRTFVETGRFPDGTVMVLETNTPGAPLLQVSVKDSSRFTGAWGYFAFVDNVQAKAVPQENCYACHEARAESDHVFTQYYPGLKLRKG